MARRWHAHEAITPRAAKDWATRMGGEVMERTDPRLGLAAFEQTASLSVVDNGDGTGTIIGDCANYQVFSDAGLIAVISKRFSWPVARTPVTVVDCHGVRILVVQPIDVFAFQLSISQVGTPTYQYRDLYSSPYVLGKSAAKTYRLDITVDATISAGAVDGTNGFSNYLNSNLGLISGSGLIGNRYPVTSIPVTDHYAGTVYVHGNDTVRLNIGCSSNYTLSSVANVTATEQ